jgi:hypothetical protein
MTGRSAFSGTPWNALTHEFYCAGRGALNLTEKAHSHPCPIPWHLGNLGLNSTLRQTYATGSIRLRTPNEIAARLALDARPWRAPHDFARAPLRHDQAASTRRKNAW